VERKPRSVEVHEIDVIDWSPPAVTLNVECGRGLYMRSLAHDLGSEIGSGGHLKELVRTRSGPFHIADSLDLETAEQMAADGDWSELHAPDTVLSGMSAAIVGSDVEGDIRHGRQLPIEVRLEGSSQDTKYRVYSSDGRFLAIVSADEASGAWRPVKVFSIAGPDVAAK
jgi:tRNA pseudouridine55 synthase